MLKKVLLVLSGALIVATASLKAQPKLVEKVVKKGKEILIPYEKYVLPNGLTVILHEDHSDPLVHVDVTYHVGSAREEIGKSGFAHFFEHMMFQGSDHVADEQHFKIVTEAGGTMNGSTNRDRTNYFQTVPGNQLEKILWLEADRMGFLLDAVTQKKFEVQRATVKNERGQNYDNRPYGLVQEYTAKNLYPYGHPYSWLTIGYVEDLNRVDVNDLKNFFLRWYGPNNATLTIGGDINPAQTLKWVQKYFGSIPRGPQVNNMTPVKAVIEKDRFTHYVDNYAKFPVIFNTFPTVPNYHKDMAALSCLAQVLGQGNNSILYQQLVKKQLALSASANSQLYELGGELSFILLPMPGKSTDTIYQLFRQALDSFEVRGVTDEDIAKFKGGMQAQLINGLQSVSGKVSQLAAFQTFTGNPNKIKDLFNMYEKVTKEEVMRVYKQYIKNQKSVVLTILPKGQEKALTAPDNYTIDSSQYKAPDYGYAGLKYKKPKDKFDRSKIPGNGANPVVNVPAYWTKTLSNGIRLIGAANNELPTVTLTLKLKGGHLLQADRFDQLGLASFAAGLMNEDTKKRTAEEMSKALQKLGSTVNISSNVDGLNVSVQCLKKNLSATLTLMEEKLLSPLFTEEAFKRIQKQELESFKQLKAQPAAVADLVFDKLNYGDNNILGASEDGTEETIKKLQLKDVQSYYDSTLTSDGGLLFVVGDITAAELLPQLAFLNKLPSKKINLPKTAEGVVVEKTKIYLIDIPKAAQTEFRIGFPTNLPYDATGEYYKAGLMNYNLGAAFNSRINLNLREEKGWTYGASTAFSSNKYGGTFEFASGIKTEATDSALVEVLKEINNYTSKGITDEEMVFMKKAIGQRDALRYETPTQKAGFIGRILEYNLPGDYVTRQNQILNNITKAEVDALAKKWLNTEKMNILLVGDKAKILDRLKPFNYEIVELDTDGKLKK
ncbi:MAG: insulinase family protein [Bacteroidetes bacterium]|nr:insulinase family protein [Bacteroidota bacterium]